MPAIKETFFVIFDVYLHIFMAYYKLFFIRDQGGLVNHPALACRLRLEIEDRSAIVLELPPAMVPSSPWTKPAKPIYFNGSHRVDVRTCDSLGLH